MGIIHECDKQKSITYIVWDGKVAWDDWLQHVEGLNADSDWSACSLFLADLQTVSDTSTIGEEAFEQAAALLGANPEIISRKRGAVVADDEFWRARLLGRLLSEFGTSTLVFNTLDIACSYLGLDKAETHQTIRQLRAKLRMNLSRR